jgi:hypothetical protein
MSDTQEAPGKWGLIFPLVLFGAMVIFGLRECTRQAHVSRENQERANLTQDLASAVEECRSIGVARQPIPIRGDILVYDFRRSDWDPSRMIYGYFGRLTSSQHPGAATDSMTLFLLTGRRKTPLPTFQTYWWDGWSEMATAYAVNMEFCVMYWPSKKALGTVTLSSSPELPDDREFPLSDGRNISNERIREWVSGMGKEAH